MKTEEAAQKLSEKLGLSPATITDLLEHGWAYVVDEKPGRFESFAYRMTR